MHSDEQAAPEPVLVELAFRLFDRMRAHGHSQATEFGLTANEAGVLLVLEPGDGIPVQALAGRLGHDTGNLTKLLTRLEASQLVVRRPHPVDRRIRLVALTERGDATRRRLRGRVLAGNPVSAGLTHEQQAQLTEVLRVLDEHAARERPAGRGTAG